MSGVSVVEIFGPDELQEDETPVAWMVRITRRDGAFTMLRELHRAFDDEFGADRDQSYPAPEVHALLDRLTAREEVPEP